MKNIRSVLLSTLLFLAVFVAGCAGPELKNSAKISEDGQAISTNVAKLFDQMAKAQQEDIVAYSFSCRMFGKCVDSKEKVAERQAHVAVWNRFSSAFAELGEVYASFGALSDDKANKAIDDAAQGAADAANGLRSSFDKTSHKDPGPVLGTIANELMDLKKTRDVKKYNEKLLKITSEYRKLVINIQPTAIVVLEHRALLLKNVSRAALESGAASAKPLMESQFDTLGLTWSDSKSATTCKEGDKNPQCAMFNGTLAVVDSRLDSTVVAGDNAFSAAAIAMASIEAAHRKISLNEESDAAVLKDKTARLRSFVEDLEKYRKGAADSQ